MFKKYPLNRQFGGFFHFWQFKPPDCFLEVLFLPAPLSWADTSCKHCKISVTGIWLLLLRLHRKFLAISNKNWLRIITVVNISGNTANPMLAGPHTLKKETKSTEMKKFWIQFGILGKFQALIFKMSLAMMPFID